jgi:hypothetical protein
VDQSRERHYLQDGVHLRLIGGIEASVNERAFLDGPRLHRINPGGSTHGITAVMSDGCSGWTRFLHPGNSRYLDRNMSSFVEADRKIGMMVVRVCRGMFAHELQQPSISTTTPL